MNGQRIVQLRTCQRPQKTYRVGGVGRRHTGAVEQEADGGGHLALSVAEGVHELLERRRALDLEEHLVVVVGDLDVEVFGRLRGAFICPRNARRLVLIRHLALVGYATGKTEYCPATASKS